jgi:phage terminase small subunit
VAKKQAKRPQEDRRARFAQEYAKDLNATQAAIRSGYAPKSAHVTASRLLSDAKVQAIIQSLHARAAHKAGITVERTLQELGRTAYFDPRKMFREDGSMKLPHEWDDDTAAAVAGVESEEVMLFKEDGGAEDDDGYREKTTTRKVKHWNKVQALGLAAEILGMKRSINPADAGGLSITIIPSTHKR